MMAIIELESVKEACCRLEKGAKKLSRRVAYFMVHLNHCCACNNKRKRQGRPQHRVKAYIKAIKNRRR